MNFLNSILKIELSSYRNQSGPPKGMDQHKLIKRFQSTDLTFMDKPLMEVEQVLIQGLVEVELFNVIL